jgi:hypothetical protein
MIPGRGFTPAQWSVATLDAVKAWNLAHPGWIADGSATGYHLDPSYSPPDWAPTADSASGSSADAASSAYTAGGTPAAQSYADPYAAAYSRYMASQNVPGYTYSPQGVQAPVGAYNYSASTQGNTQTYPPGVAAPADQDQVSTQTPVTNSTANALLANPMPGAGGSLSPSQINAANYNKTNPYAQEMMWAWFENRGWDKNAAKAEFMASLPKYAGPSQAHVTL